MRDDVTDLAMAKLLRRLAASFGKPFGTTAEAQVAEYAGAFRRAGIPLVAAEKAVDEAISTGKRFPYPGDLLDRARSQVPRSDGERQAPALDRCQHCGMGWFYAGYEFPSGAILPKLRCRCPNPDPSWYTEGALAWTEPSLAEFRGYLKPSDYERNSAYRSRPPRLAKSA